MFCIIFGLPCTCEKRVFSKEKPPSPTYFGVVFYVVFYLWLTVHMREKGILKELGIVFYVMCFLSYRVHVEKPPRLTDFGILGLSSMLCIIFIIFGLPCTREKRAFSKEKPPGAGSRKQQNVGQGTGSTTSGAVIVHS
jgi:hypothetical protein